MHRGPRTGLEMPGASQPLPVLHCVLGQVSALLGLGFLVLSMDLIPACLFCRFAVRIYNGEALWLSDDPGSHQPGFLPWKRMSD